MSYNTKNYTEQGGSTTHFGGKVVFETGCVIEGLPDATIPAATATKIGGVKAAANMAAATAAGETDAKVKLSDFNNLLSVLKAAGIMVKDS